jgi:hypothetical protein
MIFKQHSFQYAGNNVVVPVLVSSIQSLSSRNSRTALTSSSLQLGGHLLVTVAMNRGVKSVRYPLFFTNSHFHLQVLESGSQDHKLADLRVT